jgi:hypothetical protein
MTRIVTVKAKINCFKCNCEISFVNGMFFDYYPFQLSVDNLHYLCVTCFGEIKNLLLDFEEERRNDFFDYINLIKTKKYKNFCRKIADNEFKKVFIQFVDQNIHKDNLVQLYSYVDALINVKKNFYLTFKNDHVNSFLISDKGELKIDSNYKFIQLNDYYHAIFSFVYE